MSKGKKSLISYDFSEWSVTHDLMSHPMRDPACVAFPDNNRQVRRFVALDNIDYIVRMGQYDLATGRARWLEPEVDLVGKRQGPALAVLDGKVTIFGGESREVQQITENGGVETLVRKMRRTRTFMSVVAVPSSICDSGRRAP